MNTVKWELEDLAFATLYPKMYDEIVRLVAERAPSREEYLARSSSRSRDLKTSRNQGDRSPGGRSTTTRCTRR
jgi:guanosine-3',5'-bis(diphosphate) 3'-pyrophosphohydrolase